MERRFCGNLSIAAAVLGAAGLTACTSVSQSVPAAASGAPVEAGAPPASETAQITPIARPNIPFFDASLPVDRRLDDLLPRLTLAEKVSQMQMKAPAIPRLGIAAYHWWSEALHGVARAGTATVFPQAIGMAASFDPALHHDMAQVIAVEGRAKHNAAVAAGIHGQYTGLDFWSPNINIFRDPRWGRGQETYGEDPYLTSRMGVAFVTGLQGTDPFYFETIATPKHYAVHSGPEPERHRFDADPSEQDLFTTYLPAFEATVREGHADSIMAAYNSVDGLPCSANPRLLTDILRKQWGFDGYVVSDVDAVADVYRSHVLVNSPETAAALAVQAGCDLNGGATYASLTDAVRQGLLSEADINTAVRRLFTARIRMGEFDPASRDPYAGIPPTAVATDQHSAVARKMADESMVLLKNANGALPLAKNLSSIAVIGTNADGTAALYGNYNGISAHPVTIVQGIRNALSTQTRVLYTPGCPLMTEDIPLAEKVTSAFLYTDASLKTHGLLGNYYRSIVTPDRPIRARIDPDIALSYPDQSGVDSVDYQSGLYVKWTGVLVPPQTGDYQVGFAGKDAFRLFLDGNLVVDQFFTQGERNKGYAIHLEKDHPYALVAELLHPGFVPAAGVPPTTAPAAITQAAGGFTSAPATGSVDSLDVELRWTRPLVNGLAAGPDGQNLYAGALSAAQSADAVVVVLGITSAFEREESAVHDAGFSGGDRTSLDLPLVQERMLEEITAAAGNKPVTLILTSGSALSIGWAKDHVPAILQAWYPGEHGDAVADVLFGDYNPAGRLPVTFYKSVNDLPAFTDYSMKNRTYRYFTGDVLFPFGYGLSYSSFEIGAPAIVRLPGGGGDFGPDIQVNATVKNTGKVAGDEVVQLYMDRPPAGADGGLPMKSLAGFLRVPLLPGQQKTAQFTLTPHQLSVVDPQGKHVQPGGVITLRVGPDSASGKTVQLSLDPVHSAEEPPYRFLAPVLNSPG